ncbi:hypothetical protein [Proteus mirabilis]|uniref:hypothetical protein n=1 Tax=Proteus mirabilis TaxID=584 RepID=UPI0034D67F27
MLPEYNLNLLVLELLKENDLDSTLEFAAGLLQKDKEVRWEDSTFNVIKENVMVYPTAILYKELIERVVMKNDHLSRGRVIATISNIVNNDCDEVNFDYFVLELYKNAMDEMELLNLNFIKKFRSMFFNGSVLRGLAYIFDYDFDKVNHYIRENQESYIEYLTSYVSTESKGYKGVNNNFSLPTNNMLKPFKEGDGLDLDILDSFIDTVLYIHYSYDPGYISDSFISITESIIRPLIIEYIEIKHIPNNIIQTVYQKFINLAENNKPAFNAFVSNQMIFLSGTTLYEFIEHKLLLEKDWIFKHLSKGVCELLRINPDVLKMLYDRGDIRNMARTLHFMSVTGCYDIPTFCKYTEINNDTIKLNVKLHRVMSSLQFFGDKEIRSYFMNENTINTCLDAEKHPTAPFNVEFTKDFNSVIISGIETPIRLKPFMGVEDFMEHIKVGTSGRRVKDGRRIKDEEAIQIMILAMNFKNSMHPGVIKTLGDLIRSIRQDDFELHFNMIGSSISSSYRTIKNHLDSKFDLSPEVKCVMELIILGKQNQKYRGNEDEQCLSSLAKYMTEGLLTESEQLISGYLRNTDENDYTLIAFGMYLSGNQLYTNSIIQALNIHYYVRQTPNSKISKMFYGMLKDKIADQTEIVIISDDGKEVRQKFNTMIKYNDDYVRGFNRSRGTFNINNWCEYILGRKHLLDLHPITNHINVIADDELSLSDITHIVKAVDSEDTNNITASVFKKILGKEWEEYFELRN